MASGDAPWRDRDWLQAELDKRGGYSSRVGGQSTGAVSALARSLGVSQSVISTWAKKLDIERRIPPPLVPIEADELTLEGDWAVSSDWHCPIIAYPVLDRFLNDTADANLDNLLIAGDLTNQDALAQHEQKQAGAELGAERVHLAYALRQALTVVKRVVVTLGNHDRHAALKLGIPFDEAMRMLIDGLSDEERSRVTFNARDYANIITSQGLWRVCHTRSYSRLPLNYPNRLALRYGCHVAGAHRHHHALGFAANGKMICELGGLFDALRMAYLHRYTNDLPQMMNGYGLLVDGRMRCPMLYS